MKDSKVGLTRRFVIVNIERQNVCVVGDAGALLAFLKEGLSDFLQPGSPGFQQDKERDEPEVFIAHKAERRKYHQLQLTVLDLCESSGFEVTSVVASDAGWHIILRHRDL